jgi:hypothetical protein
VDSIGMDRMVWYDLDLLVQDMDQWWALMNMAMNLQVP